MAVMVTAGLVAQQTFTEDSMAAPGQGAVEKLVSRVEEGRRAAVDVSREQRRGIVKSVRHDGAQLLADVQIFRPGGRVSLVENAQATVPVRAGQRVQVETRRGRVATGSYVTGREGPTVQDVIRLTIANATGPTPMLVLNSDVVEYQAVPHDREFVATVDALVVTLVVDADDDDVADAMAYLPDVIVLQMDASVRVRAPNGRSAVSQARLHAPMTRTRGLSYGATALNLAFKMAVEETALWAGEAVEAGTGIVPAGTVQASVTMRPVFPAGPDRIVYPTADALTSLSDLRVVVGSAISTDGTISTNPVEVVLTEVSQGGR